MPSTLLLLCGKSRITLEYNRTSAEKVESKDSDRPLLPSGRGASIAASSVQVYAAIQALDYRFELPFGLYLLSTSLEGDLVALEFCHVPFFKSLLFARVTRSHGGSGSWLSTAFPE